MQIGVDKESIVATVVLMYCEDRSWLPSSSETSPQHECVLFHTCWHEARTMIVVANVDNM